MRMIDKSALMAELNSGSEIRAEAAALDLAANGSNSLPTIRELLLDPNPEFRWWATRSLAGIHDPQVSPLLRQALGDSDIGVRQCAALALRYQPDTGAISELIQTLKDRDPLLARLSADALIAVGDEAVPALIEIVQSDHQSARVEAIRALGEIGDTRAIPVLFNALDDYSALIVYWAEEGLDKMGIGMTFFKP
jgi:HEAT repeat protein